MLLEELKPKREIVIDDEEEEDETLDDEIN